jgi:putative spermidine/putrescine transport system ATP-binding protein
LEPGNGSLSLAGKVEASSFMGAVRRIALNVGDSSIHANLPAGTALPADGQLLTLHFAPEALNPLEDAV